MTVFEPRFPPNLSYGANGGCGWSTRIVVTTGGYETRQARWGQSRGRWTVGHNLRTQQEWAQLLAFHRTFKGRFAPFRFQDWTDYQASDGEGVLLLDPARGVRLAKRYTLTDEITGITYVHDRPIYKPQPGTVVFDPPGPSVDYTSGLVTDGLVGTTSWTGQFDNWVRFDTDTPELDYRLPSGAGWRSITLVEVRPSPTLGVDLTKCCDWNNVKTDFGAAGDASADDTAAINAAIAASLSSGVPVFFPAGTYRVSSPIEVNLAAGSAAVDGFIVLGEGMSRSVIDGHLIAGAPTFDLFGGGGTPSSQTNCFFSAMRDIGLIGDNTGGAVFRIGTDDYSDAINSCDLSNINVKNLSTGSGAVGTRINYLLDSNIRNLVTNCSGHGAGLQLTQSAFNSFIGGSFATADYGLHITVGYTYGNTFTAPDIENTAICVRQDSTHAQYNTFVGGQYVWSEYCVSALAGADGGLRFDNANLGTSGIYGPTATAIDPASNYQLIRFRGFYGDGATPAVPASGVAVANATGQAQLVNVYAGIDNPVSDVTINGTLNINVVPLTIQLRPGYTIALTYPANPPSWLWLPIDN